MSADAQYGRRAARGTRVSDVRVRIHEILAANDRPTFSVEFFPPKTEDGERGLGDGILHAVVT
jgi:hypothetical protein